MDKKRPAVIIIAASILVVLCLFVTGLGIATQFGLVRGGFTAGQFIPGQFRNRINNQDGSPLGALPQGGVPQGGIPQGGFRNDPNTQGTGQNFSPNRQAFSGIARLFRILRPVILAFDILMLILSIIAVIGLLGGKRWGAILAIVVAALIILATLPGMLRIFAPLVLIENLIRIVLAITVIVLLLLPSARKAFAPAAVDDDDL